MDKAFGEKVFELNGRKYDEVLYSVSLPLPGDNIDGKDSRLVIPYFYKSEKLFYRTCFENGLALSQLDYLINDKSGFWQAYVSDAYEFCILGCTAEVNSLFRKLFRPYEDTSLEEKYRSITNARINSEEFVNYLETNFRISKNK